MVYLLRVAGCFYSNVFCILAFHIVRAMPRRPEKHKPKSVASSGELRSRSALLPLVAAAVLLQLLLTWGYFHFSASEEPEVAEVPPGAGGFKAARSAVPAKCPAEWSNCPPVSGADWEALAELEASAEAPSDEDLAACGAAELLSPQRVPGMHLLCVLSPADAVHATVGLRLAVYKDMLRGIRPTLVLLPPSLVRTEHLVAALERRLSLPPRQAPYQPSAVFTDEGFRLKRAQRLGRLRRALVMEGGQWFWPPGEPGSVRELQNLTRPGATTRIVTLSLTPLVVEVENFLTADEAAHIVSRAEPHMAKSGVALKDADVGKAAKEFRTSSQYFLPTVDDPILERVDRRVQYLTRLPISHAEYIQVLRYAHLEHYSAHHDFFNPKEYANNPHMLRETEGGARNRLATVFFYLNNVSHGGETNFPRAGKTGLAQDVRPPVRDYFDCSKGLSVFPQEGKVIIFYSMLPNGEMDEMSLHGGCDVLDEQEEKWSANFWLWNKPHNFLSPMRKKQVQELQDKWV